MVIDRSIDAEGDTLPPPEASNDGGNTYTKGDPLRLVGQASRCEHEVVNHVCEHKHREIERGQLAELLGEQIIKTEKRTHVVVNIRHTTHDHEGDCETS